jgi:hypothetical protein
MCVVARLVAPDGGDNEYYRAPPTEPVVVTVPAEPAAATALVLHPAVARVLPGLRLYLSFNAQLIRTDTGEGIAGRQVTFTVAGRSMCTAITDSEGRAHCAGTLSSLLAALLAFGYDATFAGDDAYQPASGHGPILGVGPVPIF